MAKRLICGPPAAGKTSYVKKHSQPGDLIIDLDLLRQEYDTEDEAKDAQKRLEASLSDFEGDAWVIRTLGDSKARQSVSERLGIDEIIVLATPKDLALQRSKERGDPQELSDAITNWWSLYEASPGVDGERVIQPDTGPTIRQGEKNMANKFPENTPVNEMTTEEQMEYWKHQARKHEGRLKDLGDIDELKANAEKGKNVDQLVASAVGEALEATLPELVKAKFTAGIGNVPEKFMEAYLEDADLLAYVDDDGKVDEAAITERLKTLNDSFGGEGHGGFRQTVDNKGVSAGEALYESEKGK